ncbi:uncharacterized protein LY89DRAFT_664886 [Mollisia scopiformis]|uniref:Uncharacterized protein n=1 Tax=Mollisia scopiformis TaxID=149040 RepID=A0A194XPP5_MOLSC|nr:uncharacterized protein LY89DRAFT_664886 [Mollisia scopiformis]KUJ21712.1 hypothetical protein LY89DRAFT_664886 [Mollisia scopiformis]
MTRRAQRLFSYRPEGTWQIAQRQLVYGLPSAMEPARRWFLRSFFGTVVFHQAVRKVRRRHGEDPPAGFSLSLAFFPAWPYNPSSTAKAQQHQHFGLGTVGGPCEAPGMACLALGVAGRITEQEVTREVEKLASWKFDGAQCAAEQIHGPPGKSQHFSTRFSTHPALANVTKLTLGHFPRWWADEISREGPEEPCQQGIAVPAWQDGRSAPEWNASMMMISRTEFERCVSLVSSSGNGTELDLARRCSGFEVQQRRIENITLPNFHVVLAHVEAQYQYV